MGLGEALGGFSGAGRCEPRLSTEGISRGASSGWGSHTAPPLPSFSRFCLWRKLKSRVVRRGTPSSRRALQLGQRSPCGPSSCCGAASCSQVRWGAGMVRCGAGMEGCGAYPQRPYCLFLLPVGSAREGPAEPTFPCGGDPAQPPDPSRLHPSPFVLSPQRVRAFAVSGTQSQVFPQTCGLQTLHVQVAVRVPLPLLSSFPDSVPAWGQTRHPLFNVATLNSANIS